jgi:energy-coupling factor transporter transmembrane protein EcfT
MRLIDRHPGLVLVASLGAILLAALSPAGLGGREIPPWSWLIWLVVLLAGIGVLRAASLPMLEAARRVGWLVPFVLLLAVPAGLVAPPERRMLVTLALCARALAAATAATALAMLLGPSGLVHATRALGLPQRLVDILEAALASLSTVLRQVKAMLRAREARRPGVGAWSDVVAAPSETVRGFGRLIAALLLRSLERAEILEQARRARGGDA